MRMMLPRWVAWLIRRLAPEDRGEDVLGDLMETHRRRVRARGRWWAHVGTGVEAVEHAMALVRERRRRRRSGVVKRQRAGFGLSVVDLRLGLRMLVKYPGLTVVGSLAIAVAIGLGAAFFELMNDLTSPRLPLPGGEGVVGIQSWGIVPADRRYSTLEEYVRWRDRMTTVEDLSAFARVRSNLITRSGRADPVDGVEISAAAFRLAGTAPLLGRPLLATDEEAGAPAVVVIGYGRWRSAFGGDTGVIGQTVLLGNTPTTIVGVMPEGYRFPENQDLWVPLRASEVEAQRRPGPQVKVFGRLAAGVTLDYAQAELDALGIGRPSGVNVNEPVRPRLIPYVGLFFAGDADVVFIHALQVLFPLLLVVVCTNVATLVFARTATRAGEIAVRTALGASRARIVSQFFAEALVLSAIAAVFGFLASRYGLRIAFERMEAAGDVMPFWLDVGVGFETVLYVAVLTAFGAAIVGVVPALKATGRSVQSQLRQLSSGGSSLRFGGMWTFVIVFQVALTVALLPLAATSVWTAVRFERAPVGLVAERYLTAFLSPEDRGSSGNAVDGAEEARSRIAMRQEIERRLLSVVGVGSVTYARALPGMEHVRRRVEVENIESIASSEVNVTWIAADYFEDIESPVQRGRAFHANEAGGSNVVIVNESFERNVLRGQNALGRRIRYAGEGDWHEIVGVVADLGMSPENPARGEGIYHPLTAGSPAFIAVRLNDDAAAFAPRLRAIVAGIDPTLQVTDLRTLAAAGEQRRDGTWFRATISGLVSGVTILLATAGIFALMSFTVTQRTREIGIRTALGAEPRRIVLETFSRAGLQLGIGLLAGCALSIVPGYPGERVAALVAIASFIGVIGLLACAVPVRRALRIQPAAATRVA